MAQLCTLWIFPMSRSVHQHCKLRRRTEGRDWWYTSLTTTHFLLTVYSLSALANLQEGNTEFIRALQTICIHVQSSCIRRAFPNIMISGADQLSGDSNLFHSTFSSHTLCEPFTHQPEIFCCSRICSFPRWFVADHVGVGISKSPPAVYPTQTNTRRYVTIDLLEFIRAKHKGRLRISGSEKSFELPSRCSLPFDPSTNAKTHIHALNAMLQTRRRQSNFWGCQVLVKLSVKLCRTIC